MKEVLSAKPLYRLKEEEMREKHMSELQKKKEELNQLRNFMPPVDSSLLDRHQHQYLTNKRVKEKGLQMERERHSLELE